MLRTRLWLACCAAISCWYVLLPAVIAIEPVEIKPLPTPQTVTPNCNWQPLYWCFKAPYCGKPGPCPPPCDYEKCCVPYCAKPLPCPPSPCQRWCPDCYCSKPPVCCFPGNPCGHCDACAKQGCLKHGGKR